MKHSFWSDSATSYIELEQTATNKILHPEIVNIVHDVRPINFLDYGCGDGRMCQKIDESINISVYDISDEMLAKAKKNLSEKVIFYKNDNDIPNNFFNMVASSLVFVCISNKIDYMKSLKNIYKSLKSDGLFVLGLTHPCFRQYPFSDFYTEFCKGTEFNYLEEGKKFSINIHDISKKNQISFFDYHWSLSFTINSLIETGFKINKVIETYDDKDSIWVNKQYSPFMIIVAEK